MGTLLGNFLSSGASKLVNAVGEAVDRNTTTKEEIEEQETLRATLNQVDRASARESYTKVQQSENASSAAKHIQPVLAILIVVATMAAYGGLIFGQIESSPLVMLVVGSISTISTQVIAFYFGSSQGSKDKQAVLEGR